MQMALHSYGPFSCGGLRWRPRSKERGANGGRSCKSRRGLHRSWQDIQSREHNAHVGFNVDTDAPKIYATDSTYTESSMSFMTLPEPTLPRLVPNHGKLIVVHGSADPVFSVNDTINWYESFRARYGNNATDTVRLFIVPGMSHSRGGPATDQFDMVDALVNWVERGIAPNAITAKARGKGAVAPAAVNAEVPSSWSPGRTRPLCAYPEVPKYKGSGDIETASSFSCVTP